MSATLNELLLRGARRHDRHGVFLHWDNGVWVSTPDWRADRHSIRIALALRERVGVGPGDAVALSMSLRVEWALIERAVWGLSAITVPWDETGADVAPVALFTETAAGARPQSVKAVVALDDGSYAELMEHGGVLDTPERATQFRARARETPPEALASIEKGRELSHQAWMRDIARFRERHPPVSGQTQVLRSDVADRASRVPLYSAWGDGVSRIAFGAGTAGTYPEGFVRLAPDHE